jgi:hypothetical protein
MIPSCDFTLNSGWQKLASTVKYLGSRVGPVERLNFKYRQTMSYLLSNSVLLYLCRVCLCHEEQSRLNVCLRAFHKSVVRVGG